MLYELLTYALPFKGNEPAAVFVKILREDPPPLSTYLGEVPPELQACVSKALAKKTHDRYQTAEELGFDLLQIQKRIKQGMAADLVIFDPEKIRDLATFEQPNQLSQGMDYVLVNGVAVVASGKMTGALPGKVLRGQGYVPR